MAIEIVHVQEKQDERYTLNANNGHKIGNSTIDKVGEDAVSSSQVESTTVLVVGAGFSGIASAFRLHKANIDYIHIEKESTPGGVWYKNHYPGLSCDVPTALYSLSFAPFEDSELSFAMGPEIQQYLQRTVEQYLPKNSVRFNTSMEAMQWNPQRQLWEVKTSAGTIHARYVIVATGPLDQPSYPNIRGLDSFTGTIIHTADWDSNYNFADKKVGVIGTGASGIQVIPEVAEQAGHLTVFQRTPAWVLPKIEHARFPFEKRISSLAPVHLLRRLFVYVSREFQVIGFTKFPPFLRVLENFNTWRIEHDVKDPKVVEKLVPRHRMGCKRILLSNKYYPTFNRDNVTLETRPINSIRGNVVTVEGGEKITLDALVVATGYNTAAPQVTKHIVVPNPHKSSSEEDTYSLQQFWEKEGISAFVGTNIPGFPNLFMPLGPGTAVGHTSMVHLSEKQVNYSVEAIQEAEKTGEPVDISYAAYQEYNTWFRGLLSNTVWTHGGCSSWYIDSSGKGPAIWPTWVHKFNPSKLSKKFTAAGAASQAEE